jgi:hypothetical protein
MINAKQIIEHFHPCNVYKALYLYHGIIQSNTTLRDVLYNDDALASDKEWLIGCLLSRVHPHFNFVCFYGDSLELTFYEKNRQRNCHYLLSDIIPYLEEVAYYILYEQDEEEE